MRIAIEKNVYKSEGNGPWERPAHQLPLNRHNVGVQLLYDYMLMQ